MTTTAPEAAPQAEVTSLQCQQCGSRLQLRRLDKTVACPYCLSTNVVKRPPRPGIPPPAFVVGFARPEAEVRQLVARWGRRAPWYAPGGLRRLAVELLKPVYVPAYLFTGEAACRWSARVGYEFGERKGKQMKRDIEWREVHGQAQLRLSDILVSASHQVKNDELEHLEPFDLGRLARYSPAAIAGWPAEEAARTPEAVEEELDAETEAQLRQRITAIVPGEKRGAPEVQWKLENTRVDLLLVPVWTMLVRYSPTSPRVRVLVNGQTGEVWGKVPMSLVKVTLAALTGLALLVGVLWLIKLGGHR